MFIMLPDSE